MKEIFYIFVFYLSSSYCHLTDYPSLYSRLEQKISSEFIKKEIRDYFFARGLILCQFVRIKIIKDDTIDMIMYTESKYKLYLAFDLRDNLRVLSFQNDFSHKNGITIITKDNYEISFNKDYNIIKINVIFFDNYKNNK